ncbi:MAG: hypothetical protein J7513_11480 [Solirubrobacteraceae bacterium]|nr:hypothetical protein [Solirubrobacteraceae bacterium]
MAQRVTITRNAPRLIGPRTNSAGGTPAPQAAMSNAALARRLAPGADAAATSPSTGGLAAAAPFAVLARDPSGFSGPSYARHGPAGSAIEDRRSSLAGAAASTQEVDNSCLDAAKKLVDSGQKLYAIASDLDKRASAGIRLSDDKDLIALAKDVRGAAKALGEAKASIETLKKKNFDFSKSDFSTDPQMPSAMAMLKASVDSIAQAPETDAALDAFQANPNRETANAWATAVGKQFSAAKSIAAALPFPPGAKFMQDYFVGLLGAPEAYIAAFQALVSYRYGELDKAAGIDDEDHKLVEPGSGGALGSDTVWAGPSSPMVQQSFFAIAGGRLYEWIKAHRKIDGNDLWRLPTRAVAALLIRELGRDPSWSEEDRAKAITWLEGQM